MLAAFLRTQPRLEGTIWLPKPATSWFPHKRRSHRETWSRISPIYAKQTNPGANRSHHEGHEEHEGGGLFSRALPSAATPGGGQATARKGSPAVFRPPLRRLKCQRTALGHRFGGGSAHSRRQVSHIVTTVSTPFWSLYGISGQLFVYDILSRCFLTIIADNLSGA